MKRILSLLIVLFALVFTVQAVALANSETTDISKKFPYSAKAGGGSGPEVKLLATEINPDLYQEVTLRLECGLARGVFRKAKLEKATIRFQIPKGMEIVSGDTLWIGAIARGQTVVREIVIKPTEKERFFCYGFFDIEGYYIDGEKRYPPSGYKVIGFGSKVIRIKVKGAPDPRVKRIKKAIEELKKELKEVEEGKAPKDTSGYPLRPRPIPPWLNQVDKRTGKLVPYDSLTPDSLKIILDSLQQEYEKLSNKLYYHKTSKQHIIPLPDSGKKPKGDSFLFEPSSNTDFTVKAIVNHSSDTFWVADQFGNVLDCSWSVSPSWLGTIHEFSNHKVVLEAGSSAGSGTITATPPPPYGPLTAPCRVIANFTINGTFNYVHAKEGNTRVCPEAYVLLIDGDTGETVDMTLTDDSGFWQFTNINFSYVKVLIVSQAFAANVVVNDDHDHVWGAGFYYRNIAGAIPDNDILEVGTWTFESEWAISSALNICRAIGIANDFATIGGSPPDRVDVEWGPEIQDTLSSYNRVTNVIRLSSIVGYEDQWDESVIYHEYGHFLMDEYAHNDIPHCGGIHYWSYQPQHPNSAYSEGWANFFSMAVNGDPRFLNRYPTFYYCCNGENSCDDNVPVGEPCPSIRTEPCPDPGDSIEAQVTALLWDMYDQQDDVDDCNGDVGVSESYLTIWSILDVFKVNNHNPYNIKQFCMGWSDMYGASEAMRNLWAAHGIPEYPYIYGDLDCDRASYTISDLWVFMNFLIFGYDSLNGDDCPNEEQHAASDVDRDGLLWSINDLVVILIHIHEGEPGEGGTKFCEESLQDSLIVIQASGTPGDTAVLPISLTNSLPVTAFNFHLLFYDSILTAIAIEPTPRTESFEYFDSYLLPGKASLIAISNYLGGPNTPPLPIGSGPVANVIFEVAPNAPVGDVQIIFDNSLPRNNGLATNAVNGAIFPTLINGIFTVTQATGANGHARVIPTAFSLGQNYPDPFNPSTNIEYSIPERTYVKMEVYNLLGRKVATLVDGQEKAGIHRVTWDGRNTSGERLASGIYFYRIRAGDFIFTRKMLLLR